MGMQTAGDDGVVVTLVAGEKLYSHLNFTSLGRMIKHVPGEKEEFISTAMVYDPEHRASL